MNTEEYKAAVTQLASDSFHGQEFPFFEFAEALREIEDGGIVLDQLKRQVFYGAKATSGNPDGIDDFIVTDKSDRDLFHGLIGIITEAAELVPIIGNVPGDGERWPIDAINLKEELGDLMFYITLAAASRGWTLDDIIQANIAKLRRRYPDLKFTQERATNRDVQQEREALGEIA